MAKEKLAIPEGALKLSPSDFAYLYEECARCTYLKIVHGLARPERPMPGIFSKIDSANKRMFQGEAGSALLRTLGIEGHVIEGARKKVTSTIFYNEDFGKHWYISGMIDDGILLDDQTIMVTDYKTTDPRPENLLLLTRQIMAYGVALAYPLEGEPVTVSKVSLITYAPEGFPDELIGAREGSELIGAHLWGPLQAHVFDFDPDTVFDFVRGVMQLCSSGMPDYAMNKKGDKIDCNHCRGYESLKAVLNGDVVESLL